MGGCVASKLEDSEAVRICRDRRNFVRQAVEQRNRLAAGHAAYIQSLRRVAVALREFVVVENSYHHPLLVGGADPLPALPDTPVKRLPGELTGIQLTSLKRTVHVSKYLRSGPSPAVQVEEWPPPSETARLETHYYPPEYYGYYTGPAAPPPYDDRQASRAPEAPSVDESQWDFFWNPFSSLDGYMYPYHRRGSLGGAVVGDDEMAQLRRVREEEGIPELEEDESQEHDEDELEEEEEEEEGEELIFDELGRSDGDGGGWSERTAASFGTSAACLGSGARQEVKEFQSKGVQCAEVSEMCKAVDAKVSAGEESNASDEPPGFTVYLNRMPASMTEVVTNIEREFIQICDAAREMSVMLEASRAPAASSSNELAVKILNPVSLFRSASSRSTSSRFLMPASVYRDDDDSSSSGFSEDSRVISGSHQSTLNRLYEWEKKLYQEVKAGERLRIEYQKKLTLLRSQDINGDEPSSMDRTRAALRELCTKMKVSMHSVESISRRIEALRDGELHCQLVELTRGYARMWRAMANGHKKQKLAIDGAKLLLVHRPSAAKPFTATSPPLPATVAGALEVELRSWRTALDTLLAAQRGYAGALAAWARRCCGGGGGGREHSRPAAFDACVGWAGAVEAVSEARAMDGLDFFAAGIGSVAAEAAAEDGAAMAAMMSGRVLCAGMSVAAAALSEFAAGLAERYDELAESRRP